MTRLSGQLKGDKLAVSFNTACLQPKMFKSITAPDSKSYVLIHSLKLPARKEGNPARSPC